MSELAMLAEIHRKVHFQGGHPSTEPNGAGQGKFAGQRPTFYPLSTTTSISCLLKIKECIFMQILFVLLYKQLSLREVLYMYIVSKMFPFLNFL